VPPLEGPNSLYSRPNMSQTGQPARVLDPTTQSDSAGIAAAESIKHSRTSRAIQIATLFAIGANGYRIVTPGWFFSDDFLNFAIAREMGMSWSYLTRSLFGHLEPGHRFANWAMVELNLGWTAAKVITVLGLLICALLLDWVLRSYRSPAVVRNLSLALFGFALPLSGALIWWSAAVNCLPSIAAALLTIGCHKRALDRGTAKPMFVAAFLAFIGTLFYEFTPLTIFFIIGVEYLFRLRQRWETRRRPIIVFFVSFTFFQLLYWGYFLVKPYRKESGDPPTIGIMLKYLEWAALRGFGGSSVGLNAASLNRPAALLLEIAIAVLVLAVCFKALSAPKAIRAVALGVVGTVLGHLLVVGVARSRRDGSTAGLDLRYYSDLVWLVPVSFALVGTQLNFGSRWRQSRNFRFVTATSVAAICVVSLGSSIQFVSKHPAGDAGRFYEQLTASIPPTGATTAGGRLPRQLMPEQFFPYNDFRLSILPYVPDSVRVGSDSEPTSVILPSGRIVPAAFERLSSVQARCYSAEARPLEIPLGEVAKVASADGDLVVQFRGNVVQGAAVIRQMRDSGPVDYPTLTGNGAIFNNSVSVLPLVKLSDVSVVLTPNSEICFDQLQVAEVRTVSP
jgi:hypothetical protein